VTCAVDWIEDADSFQGLAPEWESLAAAVASPTPFDLHCWYAAIWDSFYRGRNRLAVCTVRRDGQLVAVFPLLRRGSRLVSLANVHSCVYRPLVADDEAATALLDAVMRRRASGLELLGLPVADEWPRRIEVGARSERKAVRIEQSYSSPFIATVGDFAEWREANKKRWKAPLEKKRRKMSRDHQAKFAIVEAPVDLDAELEDGLRIEASGWKGENGTAVLSTPQTAAFYRSAARAFHARDEFRLSRIALDGATVAFDFGLLHGGRLYSLKVGYDERFRSLAPALVMRLSMIERCFDLELRTHELLGDDAPWKSQFSSGTRPHVGFFAFDHGLAGAGLYAYRARMRPLLRRAYRKVRPHAGQRPA
jgi:CelD/BcsL family acetyltransferase involved in cellulose biosynthesis